MVSTEQRKIQSELNTSDEAFKQMMDIMTNILQKFMREPTAAIFRL